MFQKNSDREKQKKLEALEQEKQQRITDMVGRQDRMFNWEDKMRKQEEKFMQQFEDQKKNLRAKKLASQQQELLKDMNQRDVDAMLARHKKELATIDEALAQEQKRQME